MPLTVPTATNVVRGSYTGNGANNRNIPTGFTCVLVVVWRKSATAYQWLVMDTSNCTKMTATPSIQFTATDILLNASDGFDVDNDHANANGDTYYYVAIGE